MYYTYLLEDQGGKSWYIGYTSDLKRRFLEHINKQGGKTTSKKHSLQLIYYEAYVNKKDAEGRGRFLKSCSGRKYLKKQLLNYLETRPSNPAGRAKQKNHSNVVLFVVGVLDVNCDII